MKKDSAGTPPEPSYVFTVSDLKKLLEVRDGPCVSVYFPAHRRRTEARPDSILYRNLVREVEKILDRDAPSSITRKTVSRLVALDRPEFWERGSLGVAVFVAPEFFACYRLPMEVPTLEVVGVSFHTKPMLRYLQGDIAYHVLTLSLNRVALYDGWGDELHEIPLNGIPRSIEDALGTDAVPGYRSDHARGGDRLHHQQGAGEVDAKRDIEKFFREVARGLRKSRLKDSRKPLILATQKQHASVFRKVAQLPTLLDEGISADASKLTPGEIQASVRRILGPELEQRITRAREEYGYATSQGQGSERLPTVARALAEGRVKQLLVESGRRIWGLLDEQTGELIPGEEKKNAYDVDLLDELAELALARGTDVLILSKAQMPTTSGLAATFRF